MNKVLVVKELKNHVALRVLVENARGSRVDEVARFKKFGMGLAALGSAGRYLSEFGLFDELRYEGSRDMYDKLVQLGVIDPLVSQVS